jgi:hypothetical protein
VTSQATDGHDAALALLAVQLSELAARVDDVAARLEMAEAGIRGQAQTVAEAASLAQEVTRLSQAVTGRAGDGGGRDPLAHPRVWAALEHKAYLEALRDLARWVAEILLPGYPQVGPPLAPCWPAHPAVVAELDWLYWDWLEWTGPDGRSRDAADWHDRWLPGVLARIVPELAGCAQGKHTPPGRVRVVPPELVLKGYAPEQVFIERMSPPPGRRDPGARPPPPA